MVATVAFGGSSAYLWKQLGQQRARADASEQATQKLQARIAELERPRMAFHDSRAGFDGGFASAAAPSTHAPPSAAITSETEKADKEPPERMSWTMQRHEPSPAMKRMMIANMRQHNRRMYADVGDALGLDKETALKLVDLITQQETAGFESARDATDPTAVAANWEEFRRQKEKAISDLIGPDKVASLQEYQQSLPARQEFDVLSQQLAGTDLPLTQDQSRKLLDVYVTERARVPMPQYTEGTDGTEYGDAIKAWQADYAQRVSDEAAHILNPDQLTAYNEIQQWQKEMREQLPAMPVPGGPHGVVRGARAGTFNATYVNGAATNVSLVPTDVVIAPPPAEKPRKP
jgi:hypothetical protein